MALFSIETILFEGKCLKSNAFLKVVSRAGRDESVSSLSPEILFFPEGNQQKLRTSYYLSFENFFKEEKNRKKRFSIGFNVKLLSPDGEVLHNYEIVTGKELSKSFYPLEPDWGVRDGCYINIFKKRCRNLARIIVDIHWFLEEDEGPTRSPPVTRPPTELPSLNAMAIEDDIEFVKNMALLSEGLFGFTLKVIASSFRVSLGKIKLPPPIPIRIFERLK